MSVSLFMYLMYAVAVAGSALIASVFVVCFIHVFCLFFSSFFARPRPAKPRLRLGFAKGGRAKKVTHKNIEKKQCLQFCRQQEPASLLRYAECGWCDRLIVGYMRAHAGRKRNQTTMREMLAVCRLCFFIVFNKLWRYFRQWDARKIVYDTRPETCIPLRALYDGSAAPRRHNLARKEMQLSGLVS